MTVLEKLRTLLPHWLDHNHAHAAEYRKWTALLKEEKSPEIAALIEEAIALTEQADHFLTRALEKAGGPTTEHKHHDHL